MATETPKIETQTVQVGPQKFVFAVKYDNRSEDKKGPFLALEPKTLDLSSLSQFAVAAGQGPLITAFAKTINKIIGPATKDAFVGEGDGANITWKFDPSKAANLILTAVAESISAVKDELEAKLAAARAEYDDFFNKSVMPLLAGGKVVPGDVVNRMSNLRMAAEVIQQKLNGKARKPKAAKPAEAPAK